jgi:hypothetical protein
MASVQQDYVSDQIVAKIRGSLNRSVNPPRLPPKILANQSGVKNPTTFAKTLKSLPDN